jgi:hypothetical protein
LFASPFGFRHGKIQQLAHNFSERDLSMSPHHLSVPQITLRRPACQQRLYEPARRPAAESSVWAHHFGTRSQSLPFSLVPPAASLRIKFLSPHPTCTRPANRLRCRHHLAAVAAPPCLLRAASLRSPPLRLPNQAHPPHLADEGVPPLPVLLLRPSKLGGVGQERPHLWVAVGWAHRSILILTMLSITRRPTSWLWKKRISCSIRL